MATPQEPGCGKPTPCSGNKDDEVTLDGVSRRQEIGAQGIGEFRHAVTPAGHPATSDALTVGDRQPEGLAACTGTSGERAWM